MFLDLGLPELVLIVLACFGLPRLLRYARTHTKPIDLSGMALLVLAIVAVRWLLRSSGL